VVEGGAGVFADRTDRSEAHHDEQRQHHGVLNCRGTVFRNQKLMNAFYKGLHSNPAKQRIAPGKRPVAMVRMDPYRELRSQPKSGRQMRELAASRLNRWARFPGAHGIQPRLSSLTLEN